MDRNNPLQSIPQGTLELLLSLSSYGPHAVEIGLLLVEQGQMASLGALNFMSYSRSDIVQRLCASSQPSKDFVGPERRLPPFDPATLENSSSSANGSQVLPDRPWGLAANTDTSHRDQSSTFSPQQPLHNTTTLGSRPSHEFANHRHNPHHQRHQHSSHPLNLSGRRSTASSNFPFVPAVGRPLSNASSILSYRNSSSTLASSASRASLASAFTDVNDETAQSRNSGPVSTLTNHGAGYGRVQTAPGVPAAPDAATLSETLHTAPATPIPQPALPSNFFCTVCQKLYKHKNDWQKHESSHYRKELYRCQDCLKEGKESQFTSRRDFQSHHKDIHKDQHKDQERSDLRCYHADGSAVKVSNFSRWGCGFCAEPLVDLQAREKHVGDHFKQKKLRPSDWKMDRVLLGLLKHPDIQPIWMELIETEGYDRAEPYTGFSWPEKVWEGTSRLCTDTDASALKALVHSLFNLAQKPPTVKVKSTTTQNPPPSNPQGLDQSGQNERLQSTNPVSQSYQGSPSQKSLHKSILSQSIPLPHLSYDQATVQSSSASPNHGIFQPYYARPSVQPFVAGPDSGAFSVHPPQFSGPPFEHIASEPSSMHNPVISFSHEAQSPSIVQQMSNHPQSFQNTSTEFGTVNQPLNQGQAGEPFLTSVDGPLNGDVKRAVQAILLSDSSASYPSNTRPNRYSSNMDWHHTQ